MAAHQATRALLGAGSPREVVDIVVDLVTALGAAVVPARLAEPDHLPLDLSFGVDEPLLAWAEPGGLARMHVEILLPSFVEDARRVVMTLRHNGLLRDEAMTDQLTLLLNRRTWDRQVHQLRAGDTVALLDFDDLEGLTTVAGQQAGDAVLASFGRLLRDFMRPDDLAARHDQYRLAVGALEGGPQVLAVRLEQLRRAWEAVRPHAVTYCVGVAPVRSIAVQAMEEAAQALATAKRAGPDRTQVAG